MNVCANCGAVLEPGTKFCTKCGTPVPAQEEMQPTPTPVYQQPADAVTDTAPPPGSKYEPISTLGFLGISLLMCVPVVGFIFLIIWAFGGCRKINQRNMARASLILCAVGLVFSLICGLFVRSYIKKFEKQIHAVTSQAADSLGLENFASLLTDVENIASGTSQTIGGTNISDIELDVSDLIAGITALTGAEGGDGKLDLEALQGLASALSQEKTDAADKDDSTGSANSIEDLMEEVDAINQEAAAKADGWPASLPDYPDGKMNSVETYRTEITGTSTESMMAYIETLKKHGFEFQDFYEIGMSEQDMLDMNGWWGTDGKLYISISCYENTVTIDHMTELPDLSSLLGG